MKKSIYITIVMLVFAVFLYGKPSGKQSNNQVQDTIRTNISQEGYLIRINGLKGKSFNHPTFSIWIEDTTGKYIQDIYVTKYIATGIFGHVNRVKGHWKEGEKFIPAALPVWMHKRVSNTDQKPLPPSPSNPVADAFTGATPQNNFLIESKISPALPRVLKIFLEINQTLDWNNYWTNNRYPDDTAYKTSSQPALVYCVTVDFNSISKSEFKLLGHSHYSGKDGIVYTDLLTITSAKDILSKITIEVTK